MTASSPPGNARPRWRMMTRHGPQNGHHVRRTLLRAMPGARSQPLVAQVTGAAGGGAAIAGASATGDGSAGVCRRWSQGPQVSDGNGTGAPQSSHLPPT